MTAANPDMVTFAGQRKPNDVEIFKTILITGKKSLDVYFRRVFMNIMDMGEINICHEVLL